MPQADQLFLDQVVLGSGEPYERTFHSTPNYDWHWDTGGTEDRGGSFDPHLVTQPCMINRQPLPCTPTRRSRSAYTHPIVSHLHNDPGLSY